MKAWVLLAVVAIGGGACSSRKDKPAPAVNERDNGGRPFAKLQVNVVEKRVRVRHYVVADVDLVNTSGGDLWANGRFLVNRADDRGEVRDVWTMIEGPARSYIEWTCLTNAHAPKSEDYRVIKPGEKLSTTILLNDCHDLNRPGEYRFAVFYQDGNTNPPPPPPGAAHLTQLLQSDPQHFEVLP